MSKLISIKTIGLTAVSLTLLLGSVSTAFARTAVSLPKITAIRNQSGLYYRLHLNNNLVFDGAKVKFFVKHAGNRSIGSRGSY
jgi:hypothetical protein